VTLWPAFVGVMKKGKKRARPGYSSLVVDV